MTQSFTVPDGTVRSRLPMTFKHPLVRLRFARQDLRRVGASPFFFVVALLSTGAARAQAPMLPSVTLGQTRLVPTFEFATRWMGGRRWAEGLSRAISVALEDVGWSGGSVRQVNTDLNGETYRAHEWMLALMRTLDSPHVVHPADCIGDVGAAFAPLLMGMAATAFQRGYARGQRVLVSCSSDSGLRGACALTPAG